MTKFKINLNEM